MVSIIVPIYNAEKTLTRCIDSILNQEYQDIELLLIDDESKDSSSDICMGFVKRDLRVKYFFQKNSGPSSARNNGLKNATGEYIQFVDSDDFIEPDMTKSLVETIENTGADLAICGYKAIGNKNTRFIRYDTRIIAIAESFITEFEKSEKMFNSLCTKLYKRKLITEVFNEKYVLAEDWVFNCHYISNIKSIAVIDKILYNYWAVAPSITRFNYRTNQEILISQYSEIEEILKSKAKDNDNLSFFYRNYIEDIINNAIMETRGRISYAEFKKKMEDFQHILNKCNIHQDAELKDDIFLLKNKKYFSIYFKRKAKYKFQALKMTIKRIFLK